MPTSHFKKILLFFVIIPSLAYAVTDHYDKNWDTAIITGPLSNDKKIKYYIQPRLELIDNKYKFHSAFLFVGGGIQTQPNLIFWLMNSWTHTKRLNGSEENLYTLREQVNWDFFRNSTLSATSLTRVEERKNTVESTWLARFRENITLRLPFKHWENHSLVLFDEVFINLNHPNWINSNALIEQNRLFIGIGTQFSKAISLDAGYMNQALFKNTDEVNNVLYLALNMNF